jgi:WD40 repeat protein
MFGGNVNPGSRWLGSENGDLSDKQIRHIEDWNRLSSVDEAVDVSSVGASDQDGTTFTAPAPGHESVSSVTTEYRHLAYESESGDEGSFDLESEISSNLEELGVLSFQSGDYSKALQFLNQISLQTDTHEQKNRRHSRLLLRISLCQCYLGEWDAAAETMSPLIASKGAVPSAIYDMQQAISISLLGRGDIDNAYNTCMDVLKGQRQNVGKDSRDYAISLAILARIYDAKGDNLRAEAVRHSIQRNRKWTDRLRDGIYLQIKLSAEDFILQQDSLSAAVFGHPKSSTKATAAAFDGGNSIKPGKLHLIEDPPIIITSQESHEGAELAKTVSKLTINPIDEAADPVKDQSRILNYQEIQGGTELTETASDSIANPIDEDRAHINQILNYQEIPKRAELMKTTSDSIVNHIDEDRPPINQILPIEERDGAAELTMTTSKQEVKWRQVQSIECSNDAVRSVSFSPNGRYLAAGSSDGAVRIWSPDEHDEWQLIQRLECDREGIWSTAFSTDGRLLASGSVQGMIRIWTPDESGKWTLLQILEGNTSWSLLLRGRGFVAWSVAFSPNSEQLATGMDDRTVRIWAHNDVNRWQQVQELKCRGGVRAVAFSPDGRWLAGGSSEYLWLWSSDGHGKWQFVEKLDGHRSGIWAVAFSPDGRYLASGSADPVVHLKVVDKNGRWRPHGTLRGIRGCIWSIAFSPDSRRLAFGSGYTHSNTQIWAENGNDAWELVNDLAGGPKWVPSVAFSSDIGRLASGSCDGKVRIWTPEVNQDRE